jgi:hypothetical protein
VSLNNPCHLGEDPDNTFLRRGITKYFSKGRPACAVGTFSIPVWATA